MMPSNRSGKDSRLRLLAATPIRLLLFPTSLLECLIRRPLSETAQNYDNASEKSFLKQVNAPECFAQTEPSRDTEDSEVSTFVCRYDRGSDAAAYEFKHTESGWDSPIFNFLQLVGAV